MTTTTKKVRWEKLEDGLEILGTCFQLEVTMTYKALVKRLGRPHEEDGDKTTSEWRCKSAIGVATVYDWKSNVPPRDIPGLEVVWNIGANTPAVARAFRDYLIWG